MKPPQTNITTFTDQEQPQANADKVQPSPSSDDTKHDGLTTATPKQIPIPEHIEATPKKRGLLGRLTKALFED